MLKVTIPPKERLITTGLSDPKRFYYHPILKYFFLKRLQILSSLFYRHGSSVLDVGYGSGIFFSELSKRFNSLYGIDMHNMNNIVKNSLFEDRIIVDLSMGDISNLPYNDNQFDCVVSISTLEHVKELEKAVGEIYRVLKNSGEAVLGFPSDNLIMRALHYLFDKTPHNEIHLSNERRIISVIKSIFDIEKMITFPYLFPPHMAFYVGLRCVKK